MLDGSGSGPVLAVAGPGPPAGNIVIRSLTITGGWSEEETTNAAAIEATFADELTVEDVVVQGNNGFWATIGASMVGSSSFVDVTVRGNTSEGVGGMLLGTAQLTRVVIEENTGHTAGGAWLICCGLGDVTADWDTLIRDNTANLAGGVYVDGGRQWTGGQIVDNTSTGGGGGLIVSNGSSLSDAIVTGNTAVFGGGIDMFGDGTVTRTLISGNSAVQGGGGISSWGAWTSALVDSAITENNAPSGGGIYLFASSAIACTNCDLGEGDLDNTPDDVAFENGLAYDDFGGSETFTCDADLGTCQ